MCRTVSLFVLLLSAVSIAQNGQSCLSSNRRALPKLRDYHSTDFTTSIIQHRNQAIIPSYRFNCNGNITEWGVDVDRANTADQHRYTLDLQVWRPSLTVQTTGCYSLVGNNRFTSVLLSGGVARVTPLPQNRIQFQSGDVLGFYVESNRQNNANAASRGVVIVSDYKVAGDRGFETEEVWYANVGNIVAGDSDCPYAVGSNGVLNNSTNAAPVISVSMVPAESTSSPAYTTIQPSIASKTVSSKVGTKPTLQPTPIQTGLSPVNSDSNLTFYSTEIISGAVAAAILVVVITGIIIAGVIAVIVARKKAKNQVNHDNYMVGNLAYETSQTSDTPRYSDYHVYDYPQQYLQLVSPSEEGKTTDAQKATASSTKGVRPSTTYIMNMATQRNEAYGASLNSSLDKLEYSYIQYY